MDINVEKIVLENMKLKKELEKYKKDDKVKRGDIVFLQIDEQNIEEDSNVQRLFKTIHRRFKQYR